MCVGGEEQGGQEEQHLNQTDRDPVWSRRLCVRACANRVQPKQLLLLPQPEPCHVDCCLCRCSSSLPLAFSQSHLLSASNSSSGWNFPHCWQNLQSIPLTEAHMEDRCTAHTLWRW